MTLHDAPIGATLQRTDADGKQQTVIVLSHYANLFGCGTTYRHYGSGTVLTLEEETDPRLHPEAADDWTRIDTR